MEDCVGVDRRWPSVPGPFLGGTGEPLIVLEQDSGESGAISEEDRLTREIRDIFRRSLCCFVDTGAQWDGSRAERSIWSRCNNQARESGHILHLGVGVETEVKWNFHFQQPGALHLQKGPPAM